MKDAKVLILGGAGFIGSALCEKLCKENEVLVVDKCDFEKSSLAGRGLLNHQNIRIVEEDAMDAEGILRLGDDFNYIIHATAILGIRLVTQISISTINTNIETCKNALNLASKQKKLKKFLTFSTSEAYGRYIERADETMDLSVGPTEESRWCYAASKILSEHLTAAYQRERGVRSVVIRPFNVFGPYRYGSNAMSKFIASALNDVTINISGTGEQIRAWCYIDDFADGCSKALDATISGTVFNIGNPINEISILELAKIIVEKTASKSDIIVSGSTEPDVMKRTLSINKAQKLLGYSPQWSIQDGIDRVIEWMRSMETIDMTLFS